MRRSLVAIATLIPTLVSCKDTTDISAITSILVVPNPIHLLQRDSVLLVVSAQTSNGSTVPGVSFTFASADTAVATVTLAGRVRSRDVVGVGAINVTGGGLTVPVAVTVAARVASLSVLPNPVDLHRRDSTQLSVTALDVVNQPVDGVGITYGSSDTTIATVSLTGRVRAHDSLGTALITVAAGVVETQVTVTVTTVPTAVQLSPRDTTISQEHSFQFRARVVDQFGLTAPAPPVTYQSSDSGILTVTPGGLATSVGPVGSVGVTAQSGLLSTSTSVRVLDSAIVARVPLGGRPYGAAISPTGVAYVTLLDIAKLGRANLPSQTFSTPVSVGNVPTEVAFNSTGTRAYVTNQFSQSVGVVDVASDSQIDTIAVTGDPFEVIVVPGDSIIYVSTNVNSVYGIRLATKAVVATFATPAIGNGFALRDTLLYVSTHSGGTVIEFNLRTRAVARTFTVGGTPQKLALSADGNELYIANEAGYVQFWNLVTGTQIGGNLALPGSAGYGMARRPSTGELYVTSAYFGGGNIHIIDPGTRTLTRTIVAGGATRRVVFNASGSIGFVPNEGGWVDFLK